MPWMLHLGLNIRVTSGLSSDEGMEKHENCCTTYLEGQGDLVSRLLIPITHIVALIVASVNLLTKSL